MTENTKTLSGIFIQNGHKLPETKGLLRMETTASGTHIYCNDANGNPIEIDVPDSISGSNTDDLQTEINAHNQGFSIICF